MGCASSKKQSRCRHCQSPYSPIPRSYSMHVHHPPQQKGDSYHVVALTSTTLGSLKLETSSVDQNTLHHHLHHHSHHHVNVNGYAAAAAVDNGEKKHGFVENGDVGGDNKRSVEFSLGVIEAKMWSDMIEEKIPKIIPKTPIRTPPGEPETINTWELMEGLEDTSPLRSSNHLRSFSFGVVCNPIQDPFDRPKSRLQENGIDSPKPMPMGLPLVGNNDSNSKIQENGSNSPKPLWLEMAGDDSKSNSVIADFDPDVISTFRKSLEDLTPDNPFYLRPLDNEKPVVTTTNNNEKTLDVTELKKINGVTTDYKCLSFGKDKAVVYFTSLRGVRKTYEDCCHVRQIIKGAGVRVDERDVSMHSGFKDELKELLGDRINGVGLNLPRVFVGRKYIGGAEEIRRIHEDGLLEKVLESCEKVSDDGFENGDCGGRSRICEACGDVRFVPCETCSGSCKIYYEGGSDNDETEDEEEERSDDDEAEQKEEEEEEEEEGEDGEFGFRRCPDCNENGLIRCPVCCD